MPAVTTSEQLRGLYLSAVDLKSLTGWPDALIEDYLALLDNLVLMGNKIDANADDMQIVATLISSVNHLKSTIGETVKRENNIEQSLVQKLYSRINQDFIRSVEQSIINNKTKIGVLIDRIKNLEEISSIPRRELNIIKPYGSFYGDNISQTITVSATDIYYELTAGLTGGAENGCTFQNAHEIIIVIAGNYLVNYSMSVTVNSANQTVESEVMINGTHQDNTSNHGHANTANDQISLGGTGILTLAVDDVVSLSASNHSSTADITVEHANLTIFKV